MKKWLIVFVVAVASCVIFVWLTGPSLLGLFSLGISEGEVGDKVKNLYELANPGTAIEVLSISEESGLYKIILRLRDISGTSYREAYVTKDGRLLTEGVILIEESIAQIERVRSFVDCLDENGVRIYGISNQTATLLQLNLLGMYSGKLFVPCDGDLVTRCVAANVTQVPSVVIGRYVDPGVKTVDWFEVATGCKF